MYPEDTYQPFTYETDTAVYFFTSAIDPLNNWSAHKVDIWGQHFPTLEHAYHWKKYETTSPEIAAAILSAPSPAAAMAVDRNEGKDKRRSDWDSVKVSSMRSLLRAKFMQNEDARTCLLKTGHKQIVENSPFDSFWGCGSDKSGENTMGILLMELREELRSDAR
ncbi:MAG: NADAR family protein [Candidatus Saccharimonadales bacterium]|jgi:ribA/ribD-fused uncharacterized protein